MLSRLAIVLLLMLAVPVLSHADKLSEKGGGTVTGVVVDSISGVPIEYANVIVFSAADSMQVSGSITDKNGRFTIAGIDVSRIFVDVLFMGFEKKRVGPFANSGFVDLKSIELRPSAINLEQIEIEGESLPISFEIDKKVIHVDQQLTVISGTAVDVLENVPSVTVDIEGNVSLRGSGNFTVLIDGRPSVLDPNEALQQIPASSIEDIEIVTNPSAKYDPNGTSGIINIILKKNEKKGNTAVVNMNVGWDEKYGGDALYTRTTRDFKATFGIDYSRRFFSGIERELNQTTQDLTTSFISSEGDSRRGRISYGVRGDFEFYPGKGNTVNLGGRFGSRSGQRDSDLDYDEWTLSDPSRLFYTSVTDRERSGQFYALNANYLHQFSKKKHEFSAELFYSYRDSDEETLNALLSADNQTVSGQISTESGPGKRFRAKTDYVLPLRAEDRFETGFQSELNISDEGTGLFEYDTTQSQYVLQPQFNNRTEYTRSVQAAYVLYSGKLGSFGYQGGLRGEYTDREVQSASTGETFVIDRWDFFPTVHMSYELPKAQQVMVSYTRRIDRPRGWYLEPFLTWMDAYNVRSGNPELEPEYIDSFEAGYQRFFGRTLVSAEAYYRVTDNKIERVRSVFDENVTLRSIENVGKDYALGVELMANLDFSKKWTLNLLGNLYDYRVEGTLLDESFDRSSFNWTARANNTLKLTDKFQLQIDGLYNSPTVYSQGRFEGYFTVNAAARYDFVKNRLSATLQARDLLGTAKHEFESTGPNFFVSQYSDRNSPVVMLNIRYSLDNNGKEKKGGPGRNAGDSGGDDDF